MVSKREGEKTKVQEKLVQFSAGVVWNVVWPNSTTSIESNTLRCGMILSLAGGRSDGERDVWSAEEEEEKEVETETECTLKENKFATCQ